MSNSVRPHRQQPTRLPHPWDSPGKNTGVGCHFLLQCMKVKSESEVVQSCPTLRPHGLQPTRLLRPWDFPVKSTGVGCHISLGNCKLKLYYCTPLRMAKIQSTNKQPQTLVRMWSRRTSHSLLVGIQNKSHFGRQFGSLLQN